MPDIGYIDVLATTSRAHIPLMDVAISVTATDGTALAMRLTDRNGQIPPIAIPAPEPSAGQTPDTGVRPFTPVNVYARLEGYAQRFAQVGQKSTEECKGISKLDSEPDNRVRR